MEKGKVKMVDFKYQFTVKNRDGSKITREGTVQDTTYTPTQAQSMIGK